MSQLDLKSKLKQRSVVDKIKSIDWDKTSDGPMVVEFDPTTVCNLACPDCISRDLLNHGFFSRERIMELTKEMVDAGVKAVVLIGGGEPLAHPSIGSVIEYLGEHGVSIGLTTNGLLIDRYMDRIAKYCNWVRVSMDAGTEATFHRIRPSVSGKPMFNKAIDNMRRLATIKKGKLGYSFMIYAEGRFDPEKRGEISDEDAFTNVNEILQAAKLAKEIGCNYFEVKPMYDSNHYAIAQCEKVIKVAAEQTEEAVKLSDDNFKVLRATKLRHVLAGEGVIEKKEYHRCAVAQLRTLVTPLGVFVCPYFRGREDMKIGDVRKTSFQEMWHGKQRAEVLARLDPVKHCQMHCIRHDSNLIIEKMISGECTCETLEDYDLFI